MAPLALESRVQPREGSLDGRDPTLGAAQGCSGGRKVPLQGGTLRLQRSPQIREPWRSSAQAPGGGHDQPEREQGARDDQGGDQKAESEGHDARVCRAGDAPAAAEG